MHNDARRGAGAVLIAFAAIGLLLWLAATRLSPDTTLGAGGLVVGCGFLCMLGVGIVLVRR